MSYPLLRRALFKMEPEQAHAVTFRVLRLAAALRLLRPRPAPITGGVNLLGLNFPNRLGLAAGLDKNGVCVDALHALGFGFVEVGTVTPRPQSGNPSPRIFRIPRAEALINRMGFPNEGAEALARCLQARRTRGICGVNIGKNASTPLEEAVHDYVRCLQQTYSCADYLVVNVSSPNTKGLRALQEPEQLCPVLLALYAAREARVQAGERSVPILVKIAPDLTDSELVGLADLFTSINVEGVIATNTTMDRPGVSQDAPPARENGGLSGRPLHPRALEVVRRLRQLLGPKVVIVGVGGIFDVDGALAMRAAGADLIQVYTGFIYRGPALIREIVTALAERNER
ncbi:MAG: quinone-dependent dihydroorotate dehydrogenase [Steroidobacteraceae bacterium]